MQTASQAILQQLSMEHRRVLSSWRALILLRRATFTLPSAERRWTRLPDTIGEILPLLRQMRQRGDIRPIPEMTQMDEVIVPYARQGVLDEREILFESNPYAALSHFSALVFFGLTEEQPKNMTATVSSGQTGVLLPIGTLTSDWEDVEFPVGRRPTTILGRSTRWQRIKPERFFGFAEYQPLGFSLRYTVLERTLIDAIQAPELCGGIGNVLRAWGRARNSLKLGLLIDLTDQYGVALLRQRAGFVLEQLGLSHPELDRWRMASHRGGSSKLVGSEPFSPRFDENWNISLNAPIELLEDYR